MYLSEMLDKNIVLSEDAREYLAEKITDNLESMFFNRSQASDVAYAIVDYDKNISYTLDTFNDIANYNDIADINFDFRNFRDGIFRYDKFDDHIAEYLAHLNDNFGDDFIKKQLGHHWIQGDVDRFAHGLFLKEIAYQVVEMDIDFAEYENEIKDKIKESHRSTNKR